jgi:hypothetical protein
LIHLCNITTGYGTRIRVLAARENVRDRIADFDVLVLIQERRGEVYDARALLEDFPRGAGVDGLFALILNDLSDRTRGAKDENGTVVPLPEWSADDWAALAKRHWELAKLATDHCIETRKLESSNPATASPARRRKVVRCD